MSNQQQQQQQQQNTERKLRRTYYYQNQPTGQLSVDHNDYMGKGFPSKTTNVAFCRESCSDSGDSGICVDSCSEQSFPSPNYKSNFPASLSMPSFPHSPSLSTLKIRKGHSPNNKKSDKPLKVRFADSDQFESRNLDIESQQPSPPPLPPPPQTLKYYYISNADCQQPQRFLKNDIQSSPRIASRFYRQQQQLPSANQSTLNRLKETKISSRDASRRRSKSLARDYSSYEPSVEIITNYANVDNSWNSMIRMQNYKLSSVDHNPGQQPQSNEPDFSTFPRKSPRKQNLHIAVSSSGTLPHPGVMPYGSCNDITHLESTIITNKTHGKPKFSFCVTSALHKFASKFGSQEKINIPIISCKESIPVSSTGICDPLPETVKARLMGIDSRGIHVIELQKFDEGPFGFYISTGIFKKKKGIYISRVTARNLHNYLNVGDRIMEIDNIQIKAKPLEHIQMMMMNKEKVVLKILPLLS